MVEGDGDRVLSLRSRDAAIVVTFTTMALSTLYCSTADVEDLVVQSIDWRLRSTDSRR